MIVKMIALKRFGRVALARGEAIESILHRAQGAQDRGDFAE
jgi:hypothetical protein